MAPQNLNVKLFSMSNTVGIPEAGIEVMQAPDQRDLADILRYSTPRSKNP